MIEKTVILGVVLIFVLGLVSGRPDLSVTGFTPVSITAGQSYSDSVTLHYNGGTDTVVHLSTSVRYNGSKIKGRGIHVVYSENPVIVGSHGSKTVDFNISTSNGLAPGNYMLSVNADTQVQKQVVSGSGGGSGSINLGNIAGNESGSKPVNNSNSSNVNSRNKVLNNTVNMQKQVIKNQSKLINKLRKRLNKRNSSNLSSSNGSGNVSRSTGSKQNFMVVLTGLRSFVGWVNSLRLLPFHHFF